MSDDRPYRINLEERFGKSTVIDIPAEVAASTDDWVNETLTAVNDSVVRLGIVQGEFHWHKHDEEDEFFLVLDGQLLLDIEPEGTIVLSRHQAYTVPRGVVHRSRAPERTVILMIEPAGVVPTGD